MTDEETRELMARYGVTATQKTLYHYQGCKYENLKDALNYAQVVDKRTNASSTSAHPLDGH